DLDELTNGLHPGQMVVVAARPAVGKALALDTVLPTPDGTVTMGEVAVGDRLLGADGVPPTAVRPTDVLPTRPCTEVEFSEGTGVVADAAHQWCTETLVPASADRLAGVGPGSLAAAPEPTVVTTEEIARTLRVGGPHDQRFNHSVANARSLDLPG